MSFIVSPGSTIIFLGSSGIGPIAELVPPPLAHFDVYYLEEFLNSQQGIEIRWSPISGADIAAYRLYKSPDQTQEFDSKEDLIFLGQSPSNIFSANDPDGTLSDYYGISAVSPGGVESAITPLKSAQDFVAPVCRIEGVAVNLQGARLVDVKVTARLINPPSTANINSIVSMKQVHVLTHEDGRFSLPVLQGARVILEIDEAQVSDPIMVPNQPFVPYMDLPIFKEYQIKDIN